MLFYHVSRRTARVQSVFVCEDRWSIERPKTAEYFKAYSRRAGIWLRFRFRNLSHIPARRKYALKYSAVFGRSIDCLSSYTNPDLSLISHTEYRYHSRTCMASNYGSDIVDQYIVNTHFLADKFCHIFCIFNTIPMCDHDNIIIPAL